MTIFHCLRRESSLTPPLKCAWCFLNTKWAFYKHKLQKDIPYQDSLHFSPGIYLNNLNQEKNLSYLGIKALFYCGEDISKRNHKPCARELTILNKWTLPKCKKIPSSDLLISYNSTRGYDFFYMSDKFHWGWPWRILSSNFFVIFLKGKRFFFILNSYAHFETMSRNNNTFFPSVFSSIWFKTKKKNPPLSDLKCDWFDHL